ncbi:MAG TPA: cation-translocating P-type ATPase [Bacteroidia bacterium]|nr:cation-translocating P-type ATPase [Bacteroidia bacterium]
MEPDKQLSNIYHSQTAEDLARTLKSDTEQGLEEREVVARLDKYGPNAIEEEKAKSPWLIFITQFKSPIVYILVFATALSFWFKEWLDGIAILVVIFLNAIVGFYMEYQAEQSMKALQKMVSVMSRVVRHGKLKETDTQNLVPGDIVFLEAGDLVPADGRIVKHSHLQVDEAPLTGESVPVEKDIKVLPADTPLAERINMVYKGTAVTRGNVYFMVCATGMKTELGKIASMVQSSVKAATPLEQKLEQFSKRLIKITLLLVVVIFIAGLLNGQGLVQMLSTAVALAVAAIPEGLPIVATVALAKGMLKMARRNVIVKKLSSVETLGGTNVICSDKTGTLTQNIIEVIMLSTPAGNWENGQELDNSNHNIAEIIKAGVLCNTSEVYNSGEETKEVGDPLETALLKFADNTGRSAREIRQSHKKLDEQPFSSETRIMATLHEGEGRIIIYAKGAVEEVLKNCSELLNASKRETLNEENRQRWLQESEELSAKGLRVIAVAGREGGSKGEKLTDNLVFYGLIGMIDPPRKEVQGAIEECREAGIKVVMITGDHPSTAAKIATDLGIMEQNTITITGKEMNDYENLGEDEKNKWVEASVFARVTPRHKLDLVKVYQEKGYIVGMTGDGVNDAPAIKKADIGIAMGLRGTQVAQSVSDMVLKDDSFLSIVAAIRYGRVIFENIRKFVIYLLSCNLSELLVISVISIFNFSYQLLPLQILFINLITDVLPALALGVTGSSLEVMKKKPRKTTEPIVDRKRWKAVFSYSVIISAVSIAAVWVAGLMYSGANNKGVYNNVLFFSLISCQLLHVFNMSSGRTSLLKSEVTRNRQVWYALAISVLILVMVHFIPPVAAALSIGHLTLQEWTIVIAAGFISLIVAQLAKGMQFIRH